MSCLCALELNYISEDKYLKVNKSINEVSAMLISFLKFLEARKTLNPIPLNLIPLEDETFHVRS